MRNYSDCIEQWNKFNFHCEFFGCPYNQDGVCVYASSPIRYDFAKVCYDANIDYDVDDYEE